METIPLSPVFQNPEFQRLKPAIRFFVLNAVYKLCREGKADEPLPSNLIFLLQCSQTAYLTHKAVFRSILSNVMPQICRIKALKRKQVVNGHKVQSKKAIESRVKYMKEVQLSDSEGTQVKVNAVLSPPEEYRYNKGKYDHVARSKAIAGKDDAKEKLFTDG